MAVSRTGGPAAGRKFPTGANYVEALQNPTVCFEDPDLKHGTVQQSPVLGPKAISGNFASVFSVTAPGGQRYALKCFTRDSSTLGTRYQAIGEQLAALRPAELSQPWPVGIEYLPKGVLVAGEWYPALKMAWVEGTGLITWIERNVRNRAALLTAAERFGALVSDLERLGFAHGDLQHGNLLVADDGTFRLVDYDGMYVPALQGQGATENGHRNYQSPRRTSTDFGPAMDRFSSWIIHLALIAVAVDPGLWNQLHDEHGEFLILKEDDFKEPESSLAWSLLLAHPDADLRNLAARTRAHLSTPLTAIPALTTVGAAPRTSSHPATPAAAPPGAVPSWMAGHIPQPRSAPTTGNTNTATRTGFTRRRPADLIAGMFALAVATAPVTMAGLGTLQVGPTLAAEVGALILGTGALHVTRGSHPDTRESKARVSALKEQASSWTDAAAEARRIRQEIEKLDTAAVTQDSQTDLRIKKLQKELTDGEARIALKLNRQTSDLTTKLNNLGIRERQQLDAALDAAISAHTQDKLRRTPIQDAMRLSNMGAVTISNLTAAGIHTAADFTGIRYVQHNSGYGNRDAYLIRPNGGQVKVPGIGEVRAAALESWRANLHQRARKSAPTSLSPQERTAIRQRFATEKKQHDTELAQAKSTARRNREDLQKRITSDVQQANTEKQRRRTDTQRRRALLLQQQARIADADAAHTRLATQVTTTEAEHRRAFGSLRYLRFLATGH
ncbi:hypothetical protein ACN20G_13700 [Streptomyces sp. BI20]|uniref:hypothetical protein n=1 Tax=Streptomyces sp. BI20 TaxID=3403460 RepID=UPI003C77B91E